jgi:hypothetical protein
MARRIRSIATPKAAGAVTIRLAARGCSERCAVPVNTLTQRRSGAPGAPEHQFSLGVALNRDYQCVSDSDVGGRLQNAGWQTRPRHPSADGSWLVEERIRTGSPHDPAATRR